MRAPFQVLIFPFLATPGSSYSYAIFKRSKHEMWQAISGGGEDAETPREAALREMREEAGISGGGELIALDSRGAIPASVFSGTEHWPADVIVVPEYAFGVAVGDRSIQLSDEHLEFAWLPYEQAHDRLHWDSNKVALWELDQRLHGRRGAALTKRRWRSG
jgi:dATP pyrophosphohydrolase